MPRRKIAVVAFGGNALIKKGQEGTQWEQVENARETARALIPVLRDGYELVLVHGNGPQVGNILIQVEEAVNKVPPLSLDVCVAASQGSIGYLLEAALRNEMGRERLRGKRVTTILTAVVVDQHDPGFRRPTKPIGPFYTRFRAEDLMHKQGWNMIEDAGRGWRKVVPSPRPLEVLEIESIKDAVLAGQIVIAGGGGGIPVYRTRQKDLRGVEAVIDKDYTAGLIATTLRADLFVILTGVDQVSIHYGRPDQKKIRRMDASEAAAHQASGEFPEGSMGPKIRTAIEFVRATGKEVLITSAPRLSEAIHGRAGTRITAERPAGHTDHGGAPRRPGRRNTGRRLSGRRRDQA